MEPIDAGDIPLDEVIEELFSEDSIQRLLGSYHTACFVLARSGLQARFYQELIQNIDTVDATRRDRIAFIVFHGNRSSYIRDHYGTPYRYRLDGLSFSNRNIGFATDFRERIKAEPRQAPFDDIGRATDFAATLLMERFDVRETSLPCLLFLDSSRIRQPQIVCLSPSEPMESLYKDVLAPLSDELRLVDGLQKRRSEIASYIRRYEYAGQVVRKFSYESNEIERTLNKVRAEITEIPASHAESSAEHLLVERENLEAIRCAYKKAKTLEDRLVLASRGPDASTLMKMTQRLNDLANEKIATLELPPSDDREKRLHQISSSIGRLRSKIGTLATRPAAEAATASAAESPTATPIKHVIIIIGENRTFDHIFARTRRLTATTPC
jgi:hypothetical protein